MPSQRVLLSSSFGALLLVLPAVKGWGLQGHRVVAQVALDYLTGDSAKQELSKLLSVAGGQDLPAVANWADDFAHKPENAWAQTCHFFDMHKGETDLRGVWNSTCGPCCVIGAIFNYTDVLEHRAAYQVNRLADALRFVVHYVADVHQPLHVGYKEDRGGNYVSVRYDGQDMALHGLWDYGLINHWIREKTGTDPDDASVTKGWEALAAEVKSRIASGDASKWGADLDPVSWAQESHDIVIKHVYDSDEVADGGVVDDKYYNAHVDVVMQRLGMAGVRLGTLLSQILK